MPLKLQGQLPLRHSKHMKIMTVTVATNLACIFCRIKEKGKSGIKEKNLEQFHSCSRLIILCFEVNFLTYQVGRGAKIAVLLFLCSHLHHKDNFSSRYGVQHTASQTTHDWDTFRHSHNPSLPTPPPPSGTSWPLCVLCVVSAVSERLEGQGEWERLWPLMYKGKPFMQQCKTLIQMICWLIISKTTSVLHVFQSWTPLNVGSLLMQILIDKRKT